MTFRSHHVRPAMLLCCASLLGSPAAGAASGDGPVPMAEQAAIHAVITAQLDAFRHDDADRAYRIASSQIEARFGNAANFLAMVKTTYPAVYRAHDVTFGSIERQGEAIVQQVGMVGPDGVGAVAAYRVKREAGGAWRIDGCALQTDASREI